MKVLMFGWEFPPLISGGLGTACLGLTQSLHEQGVELLFVLPRLYDEQKKDHMEFLNASTTPLPNSYYTEDETVLIPVHKIINSQYAQQLVELRTEEQTIVEKTSGKITIQTIEVPSTLKPYDRPSSTQVTDWKQNPDIIKAYKKFFDHKFTYDELKSVESTVEESIPVIVHVEKEMSPPSVYTFSGIYGPDLLSETFRYAEVAETIGRKNDFDVIHVHDWMTFPAGVSAKRVSGKPLVVHVHSTEVDRAGVNIHPEVYAIEYNGMIEADRIVAVSEWTRQILINRFGIDGDKIEVVHNGVEERKHEVVEKSKMFGSHVVTFLGRITYQKGPMYFVEAAFKVLEKFPEAHFVIAGSGDMINRVILEVARRRYSSNFHFTGFLNKTHIDKLWSLSDVYVMPSVSEPFGITPLEAIQAGVPVIISSQSGVAEVVPDAIKVDFWDTDALANAICNVLQYNSLSKTMALNSMEEIKNVNWDDAAKKIKTIYHGFEKK